METLASRTPRVLALLLAVMLAAAALLVLPPGAVAWVGDLGLVSSTAGGAASSSGSYDSAVSSDGRYVAFKSAAGNLPGANTQEQIYRKDYMTGAVVMASRTAGGVAGDNDCGRASISADGRYVAFQSTASNFPGANGQRQVYRKDLSTGTLVIASATGAGAAGTWGAGWPTISKDGRYVAFMSDSPNFPGDNGQEQVYRKDLSTGTLEPASSPPGGAIGDSASKQPSVSPDGRYVAFTSDSTNFPGYNGQDQVYRKDITGGTLRLVSSTAAGVRGNSGSYNPWMSDGGRYVIFDSNSANFPGANGQDQLFRKDLATNAIDLVSCTAAGAAGTSYSFSYGRGINYCGGYVVFNSDSPNFPRANGQDLVFRKNMASGSLELVSSTSAGVPGNYGGGPGVISPEGRYVAFTSDSSNFPGANGQNQIYMKELGAGNSVWYLAEGSTAWGFSSYISIENPNTRDATARITYNTEGGPVAAPDVPLPALSQTTVNPAEVVPNTDFSTTVSCVEGCPIAVDRTMTWIGGAAGAGGTKASGTGVGEEAHNSVGVTSPAYTWYLPEGSSEWGFETWLLIQNPNGVKATCDVTYMIEGAGPVTRTKEVPAKSRRTYNMFEDIGKKDASIMVESDLPVIPERSMYRDNRRAGHDSIGTTALARDYYLAEGATGYDVGYTTYVLVQNPHDTPTDVEINYLTGSGPVDGPRFQMPANSRKTIRVNDQLPPNTDVSTHVHGSQSIIAERAMYWDNGTGVACHDSIGMDSPHGAFYLPDGQTSNGRETWTLIQNPFDEDIMVEVTYLPEGGGATVSKGEAIPANTRKTFNMAEHSGITGRASVMIRVGLGRKVMAERAMYWNNRGAGTNTIGGYTD